MSHPGYDAPAKKTPSPARSAEALCEGESDGRGLGVVPQSAICNLPFCHVPSTPAPSFKDPVRVT